MSLAKTVKNLEQEFMKKYKKAEASGWDDSFVKTAQWAWEAYSGYVRNLDALNLKKYNAREYTIAQRLYEMSIKPRYK